MKMKKQFFSLLLALCLFIAIGGTSQAAPIATGPVGYVDFTYLVNQHPDTMQANASLKAEQETIKQEFESKAVGLGDRERQELDQQLGLRLEQKRLELLNAISGKIVAAANEVVKEKGLSIIISKSEVVCGGIDVTADVLKKITKK